MNSSGSPPRRIKNVRNALDINCSHLALGPSRRDVEKKTEEECRDEFVVVATAAASGSSCWLAQPASQQEDSQNKKRSKCVSQSENNAATTRPCLAGWPPQPRLITTQN